MFGGGRVPRGEARRSRDTSGVSIFKANIGSQKKEAENAHNISMLHAIHQFLGAGIYVKKASFGI